MEKSSKLKVIGLAVAGLGMAVTTQTMAAGSVHAKGPDVHGLVQADYGSFRGPTTAGFTSSGTVTRADIAVSGLLNDAFGYNLSYRAADNTVRDAYIAYTGYKPLALHVGHLNDTYFGLETSSPCTAQTFVTSSSLNQLWGSSAPVLGVRGMGAMDMFSYQASAWIPGKSSTSYLGSATGSVDHPGAFNQNLSGQDPVGFSGRVTAAPMMSDNQVVHFGASYMSVNTTEYTQQVRIVPIQLRNTQALLSDDDKFRRLNAWNVEFAGISGPFSVQAEYGKGEYKALPTATNTNNRKHDSWYGQLSYMVTGETHQYNRHDGTISGMVNPKSAFGAWEVAARFDSVNLRSKAATPSANTVGVVTGQVPTFVAGPGLRKDMTLGVNYYPASNVKFLVNYTDSKSNFVDPAIAKRLRFWAFRSQVSF